MNAVTEEFFSNILPVIDQRLANKEYLCGNELTISDIQFYNEIATVLTLLKREIPKNDCPKLANWFKKVSTVPEIIDTDRKFKEIVTKYNFV